MRNKYFLLAALFFLLAADTVLADPGPNPLDGKAIFVSRCASCHHVNKQLTGPALAGVGERRSLAWVISFVQSSQSMVKKGDKDAVALFEKFNKIPMPDHADLTDDDIKSIVAYVRSESKAAGEETTPFKKPSQLRKNYTPLSLSADYGFFIALLASIGVLIGVLLFAVKVDQMKKNRLT